MWTTACNLALAAGSQYEACGWVDSAIGQGSGTLIAADWVLTAAHVVDDVSGNLTVTIGGTAYEAAEGWRRGPPLD